LSSDNHHIGTERVPALIMAAGVTELQGWTGTSTGPESESAVRRLSVRAHVEQLLRKFVQGRLGDGSS
jgi:hypothetical protein